MDGFYTRAPVYALAMLRLALAALASSVLFAGCAPGLSFPNVTAGQPLTVPAYESKCPAERLMRIPPCAGRLPGW